MADPVAVVAEQAAGVADQPVPFPAADPPRPQEARALPRGAQPASSESIKKSLKTIFNGLIEVKVVTIVENVELDVATGDGRTTATLKPFGRQVDALITVFNLLDGDVINVIAPNLADKAEIRAFHTAQVEKSVAVLPANLEALVKLGKAIINEFK